MGLVELLPRGRRRHPAGAARPAGDPGALAGRASRGRQAGDPGGRPRGRRVLPEARAARARPTWVETAHIAFPSGRTADEVCPDRAGDRRLDGEPRHDHLPPVAGTPCRRRPPGRAAHRPRPAAGHRLRRRGAGRRTRRARCSTSSAGAASPRRPATAACTSTCAIEPRWTFTDVRHAAIAFGRELERRMPMEVTTKWWKEERGERIFVDYNQNARDRTIASAYSAAAAAARPGLGAAGVGRARPTSTPREFTVRTMPARFAERRRPASRDRRRGARPHAAARVVRAGRARPGLGDMPYPPDYPKMPGEPMRVQPSRAKKPAPPEDAPGEGSG